MQNSKIEWTDAELEVVPLRFPQKIQELKHTCLRAAPCCLKPLPYISITLGAIAGSASRDDIIRRCCPALANWVEMIPGRCGCAAINAASAGAFKPILLADYRNRINPAFSAVGVLATLGTVALIFCIAFALIGCMVCSAHTCMDLRVRKPGHTPTTPDQTSSTLLATLGLCWSVLFSGITTRSAGARQTVAARLVNAKRHNRMPVLARRTPLQTSGNTRGVLLSSQPSPTRRNLDSALFAAHG